MNIFEAIFLGIIQGLTEFLPISSTGHLTVAGKMMNLISTENPQHWTAFIAVIQLGTLIAVLFYFRNDIISIIKEFFRDNLFERKKYSLQGNNSKLGWLIIIGSIPVAVIGLFFKDFIEGSFTKELHIIAISLIVFAIILAIAEKTANFKKDVDKLNIKDSLIIGFAQAFALIPGSSRSGTTITGGLFVGLNREAAARYSFLLSIPAVFASGLLELYESLKFLDASMAVNLLVSTIASGISGYLAIGLLLRYLRKNSTFVFIYYRVAIGGLILILLYFNIL
ncbi:MAG TPA: undecaprenyl-diphosphatase UppP [Ignavibacteria bacterium]|nr:undecaprenyl-diphosphatase UppP [Ignavibacteria bacterium]